MTHDSLMICVFTYLVGRAAEPGIPGGAAVPEEVAHAERVVLLLLLEPAAAAAAAVVFGFAQAGDYSFLCLLMGRHCFRFSLLPDHHRETHTQ